MIVDPDFPDHWKTRMLETSPIDVESLEALADDYRERIVGYELRFPKGLYPGKDAKRVRALRRRLAETEAKLRGNHTDDQWQAMVVACGGICTCCGCRPDSLTRDHILPVSLGGSNAISNIQPLCRECNSTDKFHH